ncbi:hypothetical protein SAMN05192573_108148 [Mucilaginibacter gossypii]|uniref:Uncharacterized protein n=1 Tax=Mucilaginibacter gossypii TaxID=551996 RepID=A0A1G8BAM7_9SPHI|nr:hypothetical protein SAMN05192573_108148 [Mucilaginibacter gossypii]
MRNLIITQYQHINVFRELLSHNFSQNFHPNYFKPGHTITANGDLADGFAPRKAISYPLQNPIKNIICCPE